MMKIFVYEFKIKVFISNIGALPIVFLVFDPPIRHLKTFR